jgi:CDP-glucose 4,6-dehydratase
MHYFVTGHTGFKGSWLTLLLLSRGHSVSGISLPPTAGGLFETAGLSKLLDYDGRVDIRDAAATSRAITDAQPDVVLHLAAQPLVRESYREPRLTFETNVMGTLSVLEAVSALPTVKAQVIITTDKVYRNVRQVDGYVESDPLGGHDPYSSSKAMADLLVQSWVASFPGAPTAVARAGNVIGGGDVSPDRLLPDLLRSFASGQEASIRYPDAVRPWQHVLDCVNGYLSLTEALLAGGGLGEWNFGPGPESFVPVRRLADLAVAFYGGGAAWSATPGEYMHEAELLALDATKALGELAWSNRLGFEDSVRWTVEWQKQAEAGIPTIDVTREQIAAFEKLA